jgi:cytochrome c553
MSLTRHTRYEPRADVRRAGGVGTWSVVLALGLAGLALPARAGFEEGRVKSEVCKPCHGVDGNSPTPTIPSLAGQPRQFITMALYMFREGRRNNPLMAPVSAALSNTDLNDLAAYFSAQKMALPTRQADADVVAKGRAITTANNCVACHTPTLVGQQHIPRLAGQHQAYLLEQLKAFKAGTRVEFDGTMTSAAQGLVLEDLELLSDYLATLGSP